MRTGQKKKMRRKECVLDLTLYRSDGFDKFTFVVIIGAKQSIFKSIKYEMMQTVTD